MRWPLALRSAFAALLLVVGASACAWRPVQPVVLTAEEEQLLVGLTRDPFVVVVGREREEDGFLTLRTMQGRVPVAYRFMPANDSGAPLVIRRIDDRQQLPVAWSEDQLGTGPQPRGIHR
jgi:hypothetical protein